MRKSYNGLLIRVIDFSNCDVCTASGPGEIYNFDKAWDDNPFKGVSIG